MKFSQFATNLDFEENGVWVEIGDGGSVRIARMGNPAFKKLQRELLKPYRAQIRSDSVPDGVYDEIDCQVISKTVLLDWKGMEDDKGKPIKYTPEHAYDMLKGLKDFRNLIIEIASAHATFKLQEDKATGEV